VAFAPFLLNFLLFTSSAFCGEKPFVTHPMPLTQLDSSPALIVIDLQKMVVGFPLPHPVAEIVERSAQLAREFRKQGFPVILVNVAGRAPGRADNHAVVDK
jgi:Isochorismatase family